MAYEVAPPKYVRLVQTLQSRIEDGTYPAGSLLPSEHQLVQAFGMSRPTVVRALQILRQDGWIESQQGRGTFVRGRPESSRATPARRGLEVMERDEDSGPGELIAVATVDLPRRAASALGLPSGAKALLRRWLVRDEDGPSELVSSYFPLELAERTDLASDQALPGGLRAHLESRGKVRIDHITERICARLAGDQEAELLELPAGEPVLGLLVIGHDSTGRAWYVADVVLAGDRHELEDVYSVH
ncbi:GntR family transcriptional regulator [Embleya sp. NPDC050154]|uniref:GntR family transcriptional regulator n=1 Tax=Embleya sp. NPDC050154 TaxID=3363988 RepID=UPI0037941558